MPGVNVSQPLLGAGAGAKNDWAAASARTSLDFTAQAEFKRGINVTIGLSALAQADAGLAKFVEATVRGNAFAEAEASLQVQLPLNLFQSFGLAVEAQAKAQAAAGIEVGLALVVGDFVELIRRDPSAIGIPIALATPSQITMVGCGVGSNGPDVAVYVRELFGTDGKIKFTKKNVDFFSNGFPGTPKDPEKPQGELRPLTDADWNITEAKDDLLNQVDPPMSVDFFRD